ncbi:MAG: S9 family peptidase [Chloroflexi bacterium]|nr:S9 family peptidase [Chloroflexota bacterium]
MAQPQTAPYGNWRSTITARLITAQTVGFLDIAPAPDAVYWIETRPAEAGRYVLVRHDDEGARDCTPSDYNARTLVHEYGGAPVCVHDGVAYFSNFTDQRIYRQTLAEDSAPVAITPERPLRFADAAFDATRDRLIAVCEDHSDPDAEAVNSLVSIGAAIGDASVEPQTLAEGRDFYAAPQLSPDGSQLAWLEWDHPNMPWDGTELKLARVNDDGSLGPPRLVAGANDESIFQPAWSPDGRLYFVSDRSGWWNLYRADTEHDTRSERIVEIDAELGQPHWGFGTRTYAFVSPTQAVAAVGRQGSWSLAAIDLESGEVQDLGTPYTEIHAVNAAAGGVVFIGGAPDRSPAVVLYDPASGQCRELRRASSVEIDPGDLSLPEAIEFPTEDGLTAHAFFYPARNADFQAPDGDRPPLLVMSHGGPTGATSDTLNLRRQFWTSRGIAVLDVNYGGSTGYGRDYRRRLNGKWGIVDVDDCVNGARFLVERGDVDPNRLAITGGSAGGWTTLCALTFRDVFAAGASHFGVSDAEGLATETHKFESRYMDSMIGPFPERRDLYDARSPIHHTDQLNCPVAFFQGLEDKIVLPDQSERMADALRAKGLPVAYLAFEGEQHGFRRAENIEAALEGELYFYGRIFGFDPAGDIAPIPIDNLPH